ncbi:MAG TPA: hypothetical protein EYP91_07810 [Gammaproteobacteria bacterium]|jgi:micrococcal nuclease|nr:hypothetical protein [Gammaproteobacteria bacterium]
MKHACSLIRAFLFISTVLAARAASAGGCLCNYTPATLLEVIDGDTLVMEVSGKRETIHLAKIIAPRLAPDPQSKDAWCATEGEKAIKTKDYASTLLSKASEITLDEQQRDESGEISAVVYIDNISLGQELLYKYLAIESDRTPDWCG